MNCSPTLTAEEFKVLHNSLCDLDRFSQFKEIADIVERIRRVALKSAYEQDNLAFETKHDYYREYQELHKLQAIWSVYELDPAKGFDSVDPYTGTGQYIVYDNHWGGSDVVVKIGGPTWGDLYRAADEAIRASGDSHHVFIESFTPIRDKPGHLRLSTGS